LILPGEVDVWFATLRPPASTLAQYEKSLSPDELKRANAFRFPHLRTSFVTARGVLRALLAEYLNSSADEIQFEYTDRGKPFLKTSDVEFNLSHSGEYLACAFTRNWKVGIDIEQIRPMDDLLSIAQRFFGASEAAAIEQVPPDQRLQLFFQTWTLKESLMKATGEGLGATDLPRNWFLHPFSPAPGYAGALAVEQRPERIRWNTYEHDHTGECEHGILDREF
jgi:4'-phosphopantetheinyl transferase